VAVRILCAWCCREGEPGDLGEREPLDNPDTTHGICLRHKAQVLETLPSQSFPEAELLIVVRRDDPVLYDYLDRALSGLDRVKVIVDRRIADRRAASPRSSDERRWLSTRRLREATSSPRGDLTVVRFTPE
jgi:hypothetical protein